MLRNAVLFLTLIGLSVSVVPADLYAQSSSSGEGQVVVIPNRNTTYELRLRGRLQGQFAYSSGSDEAEDYSSFEARRARLGVQGRILDDWRFTIEMNTLSSVDLDVGTLTYAGVPEANITFGKRKTFFGHEQIISSANILTFERTRLDGIMNGGKPLGLWVHGNIDVFSYYLGAINGHSAGTGRMPRGEDSYLYNASAGLNLGRFLGEGVGTRLRVDYLHSTDEAGYYRFEDAFSFSGHFSVSGFDLHAEYMTGTQHDENTISGFYVMPAYYLVPGVFQAVVRYEAIDADEGISLGHNRYADRVPDLYSAGNQYNAIYGGVNYYIRGNNLKLMLGFEFAENKDSANGQSGKVTTVIGGIRMQI